MEGGGVLRKGEQVGAKQSWGLFNQSYQGSISVSTPAKSRENKESKIQVNKLIGDLHKQLLQQGKKQSHIGFSFLFLLFELPGPNTPWKCQCYMQEFKELSFLIPLRKKGTEWPVKIPFLTELKVIMVELPYVVLILVSQASEEGKTYHYSHN